jgi:hypothetical protein
MLLELGSSLRGILVERSKVVFTLVIESIRFLDPFFLTKEHL